jgi:hypothetical protein
MLSGANKDDFGQKEEESVAKMKKRWLQLI